jgi:hypothetical protein
MGEITRGAIVRVGVDLAKRVIQAHAVDAAGRRVVGRALKRDQFMTWCAQLPAGCLVAMEVLFECASLGAQTALAWPGRAADRGSLRHPLPDGGQERQERHDRRRGDLRSGLTPEHALRAGEDLRAARRHEPAPRARGAQGRAHLSAPSEF